MAFLSANAQEIQVTGNDIFIDLDGNNFPNSQDGTLFPDTPVLSSATNSFTLTNLSDKKIHVDRIRFDISDFYVADDGHLHNVKRGASTEFDIFFQPNAVGIRATTVYIDITIGKSKKSFSFQIEGSGIENDGGQGDIMISQYYNSGSKTWIEVKNTSDLSIKNNKYVLAYYKASDDLTKEPKRNQILEIKALQPHEVRVYKFKGSLVGREVIVISTDKKKKCYERRVDIIGGQFDWGKDLSMTKGGCASEIPHFEFKSEDWIALSVSEVDDASPLQNIHLGTYDLGNILWNGSNWTNNKLPDRSRVTIIEGGYQGRMGNIEACDLIVNGHLDFASGDQNNSETGSVVVYRDLEIADTGTFEIGDKQSLVMYDVQAEIKGEIVKYENSTTLNNSFDFTYWSSPVEEAIIEEIFSGVRPERTYYFDQSNSTASDPNNDPDGTFWNVWVRASGTMKPGRGYASEASLENSSLHELRFKGKPNNGDIYEEIHYHNDADMDNDFNLIGNPYPSAINIESFFDHNSAVIDPVVYLWTHSTPVSQESGDYSFNDYATYNRTGGTGVGDGVVPSKNIGSSQGFLVRGIKKGQVVFKNSMRMIDSNNVFFKRRNVKKDTKYLEKDRIWLNLTTNQGGFNQLLVGFIEEASSEFDRGYDALKNQRSNKIGFYSLQKENKLAIQGLGSFNSSEKVNLGFDTRIDNRTYSISIADTEGKLKRAEIILTDHYLGVSHNLKEGEYSFVQNERGAFPDRFTLSLTPYHQEVSEPLKEMAEVLISNEGNRFSIRSKSKVQRFRMYDLMGRMLVNHYPDDVYFEVNNQNSKTGEVIYVEIIYENQVVARKKIYKR